MRQETTGTKFRQTICSHLEVQEVWPRLVFILVVKKPHQH